MIIRSHLPLARAVRLLSGGFFSSTRTCFGAYSSSSGSTASTFAPAKAGRKLQRGDEATSAGASAFCVSHPDGASLFSPEYHRSGYFFPPQIFLAIAHPNLIV